MDRLFGQPIVTWPPYASGWVLRPRANQIVARLENIGLLREINGYARNRRFRFDPYLRDFEDSEETKQ
jgi:hypothetical protein